MLAKKSIRFATERIAIHVAAGMPTYRLCVELFRFVSGWSDHRSLRDQSTGSIASGVSVPALQVGVILEQPTRGVPVAPPERTVPETEDRVALGISNSRSDWEPRHLKMASVAGGRIVRLAVIRLRPFGTTPGRHRC